MKIVNQLRSKDLLISTAILFIILIITLMQIILRAVFNYPFVGIEELSRYLFISFVFLGMSYYCRMDGHIKLAGIQKYLPPKSRKIFNIIIHSLSVFVFAIIAFSAFYTTITNYASTTPTLSIPFWLFFLPTVIGFSLLTIEELNILLKTIKKETEKWA